MKILNDILLKITNKSMHNDIWQDVIDYKNGTSLMITTDNGTYTGVLELHEEKGNDSWLVLRDFIIEEDGKDNIAAEQFTFDTKLAVNLKEAKRIQLFYGHNSESEAMKAKNIQPPIRPKERKTEK